MQIDSSGTCSSAQQQWAAAVTAFTTAPADVMSLEGLSIAGAPGQNAVSFAASELSRKAHIQLCQASSSHLTIRLHTEAQEELLLQQHTQASFTVSTVRQSLSAECPVRVTSPACSEAEQRHLAYI